MSNNEIAAVVFNEVKNEYGVTAFQLLSKSRHQAIREARQVFAHLMRKHTDLSLSDIGRFVNRDHTTIIHACKVVESDMDGNVRYKKRYDRINDKITDKLYV